MEKLNNDLSERAKYDYQLVLRATQFDDQQAYAEILNRYREPIYYMVYKMVRDESDAEDLTIEAFGKAFKYIKQYSPSHAFSTWLYKIATNNCIDFMRKKRAETTSLDRQFTDGDGEYYGFEVSSKDRNPEQVTINEEKKTIMRNVVKALKPGYRRLIELRYFEEYSYNEISEELELPIGTVKAQLYRAKELLSNILKDQRHSL